MLWYMLNKISKTLWKAGGGGGMLIDNTELEFDDVYINFFLRFSCNIIALFLLDLTTLR